MSASRAVCEGSKDVHMFLCFSLKVANLLHEAL